MSVEMKKLKGNNGWQYTDYGHVVIFLQDDEMPENLSEIKVFAADGRVFIADNVRFHQMEDKS